MSTCHQSWWLPSFMRARPSSRGRRKGNPLLWRPRGPPSRDFRLQFRQSQMRKGRRSSWACSRTLHFCRRVRVRAPLRPGDNMDVACVFFLQHMHNLHERDVTAVAAAACAPPSIYTYATQRNAVVLTYESLNCPQSACGSVYSLTHSCRPDSFRSACFDNGALKLCLLLMASPSAAVAVAGADTLFAVLNAFPTDGHGALRSGTV
jgi:hypothetical protein